MSYEAQKERKENMKKLTQCTGKVELQRVDQKEQKLEIKDENIMGVYMQAKGCRGNTCSNAKRLFTN